MSNFDVPRLRLDAKYLAVARQAWDEYAPGGSHYNDATVVMGNGGVSVGATYEFLDLYKAEYSKDTVRLGIFLNYRMQDLDKSIFKVPTDSMGRFCAKEEGYSMKGIVCGDPQWSPSLHGVEFGLEMALHFNAFANFYLRGGAIALFAKGVPFIDEDEAIWGGFGEVGYEMRRDVSSDFGLRDNSLSLGLTMSLGGEGYHIPKLGENYSTGDHDKYSNAAFRFGIGLSASTL